MLRPSEFLPVDFLYGLDDAKVTNETIADPFSAFFEDAQLSAAVGSGHAAAFRAETQELDKAVAAHYRGIAEKAAAPKREIATDPDEQLAKSLTPKGRRWENLSRWMRGEIALGKSASELIEYARERDPATANLLSEIAATIA